MPNDQGYLIPNLPQIPSMDNYSTAPTYENIINAIKGAGALPSLSGSLVPAVSIILGKQGQFLTPQIDAIRSRGEELAANAQSDATARNLRGSDIESAGMLGARLGALGEESKLRGEFGLNQGNTLIDVMTKAMSGDLDAARELRTSLAQAMGQQMSREQELQMFREQLDAGMSQAGMAADAEMWGALLGAGGSLGSAAIRRSDARLKENVERVGKVDGLDLVRFAWNEKGRKLERVPGGVGLIAQQVERKYPDAVGHDRDGYKTVDYRKLPKKLREKVAKLGGPRA